MPVQTPIAVLNQKRPEIFRFQVFLVEISGIEPPTSPMVSNRLTKKAVEEIYRKNSIATSFDPAKVDDIIETTNHFEAVRYIIDNTEADLTPIFIQHLHQTLTYGTYADRKAKLQPGVFRTDTSKKGIAPAKISKELTSLCKTYEKNLATIERILEFHVRFEKIHPFKDYNGRIGRLIMMKECLRHGITPFIIDDKNRALYHYGILTWSQGHAPMMPLVQSAQKRFQAKIELCRLSNTLANQLCSRRMIRNAQTENEALSCSYSYRSRSCTPRTTEFSE